MTCEVIRDLLPLCADGVASEETAVLVRTHIRGCPSCEALYQKMCRPVETKATPEELDYMTAVRRQKKENHRFLKKTYGIIFVIVAILFVVQALCINGWIYSSETVDKRVVERKLPQTLLTKEEKALAKEIFSLPQVQQAFAQLPESGVCDFDEELKLDLLLRIGKDPQQVESLFSGILGRAVWVQYQEDDCLYILEYIDSDQSGYADVLRKTAKRNKKGNNTVYAAEINAAMIGVSGGEDQETDTMNEDFYTVYTRTWGRRDWLAFLKHN